MMSQFTTPRRDHSGSASTAKRALESAEKKLPVSKTKRPDMSETERSSLESGMAQMLVAMKKLDKLDKIQKDVEEIKGSFQELQASLEYTQGQLEDARGEIEDLKETQKEMKSEMGDMEHKIRFLERRLEGQDKQHRRENVVIKGLPEEKEEDCSKVVNDLFSRLGVGPYHLQRCHRLGQARKEGNTPRPILVRFVSLQDKLTVMGKRAGLKGTKTFIQDDIPHLMEQTQSQLRPIVQFLRSEHPGKQVGILDDKIRFDGKLYSHDKLHLLPINLSGVGLKISDDHVYFAGEHTPLSNLYSCELVIDGGKYSSVEQYYQQRKCLSKNHPDIADKVMSVNNPRESMAIGKAVKVDAEWCRAQGKAILLKALRMKLQQVPAFKDLLKENKGKRFAEATLHPHYGIGHGMGEIRKKGGIVEWSGGNIMGGLLDHIASDL